MKIIRFKIQFPLFRYKQVIVQCDCYVELIILHCVVNTKFMIRPYHRTIFISLLMTFYLPKIGSRFPETLIWH
jgi:hypothetical protein